MGRSCLPRVLPRVLPQRCAACPPPPHRVTTLAPLTADALGPGSGRFPGQELELEQRGQNNDALITTLELLHALLLWAVPVPGDEGGAGLQTWHLKAVSRAAGPQVLALVALVMSGGPRITPNAKDVAERLLQRLAALGQADTRSQMASRFMVGALKRLQVDEWEGASIGLRTRSGGGGWGHTP